MRGDRERRNRPVPIPDARGEDVDMAAHMMRTLLTTMAFLTVSMGLVLWAAN